MKPYKVFNASSLPQEKREDRSSKRKEWDAQCMNVVQLKHLSFSEPWSWTFHAWIKSLCDQSEGYQENIHNPGLHCKVFWFVISSFVSLESTIIQLHTFLQKLWFFEISTTSRISKLWPSVGKEVRIFSKTILLHHSFWNCWNWKSKTLKNDITHSQRSHSSSNYTLVGCIVSTAFTKECLWVEKVE